MISESKLESILSLLRRFKPFIKQTKNDPSIEEIYNKFSLPPIFREDIQELEQYSDINLIKRLLTKRSLYYNRFFISEITKLDLMPDQLVQLPKISVLIAMHSIMFIYASDLNQIQDQYEMLLELNFRLKKFLTKIEYEFLVFGITEVFARFSRRLFPTDYIGPIFDRVSLYGFNAATEVLLNLINLSKSDIKNEEIFLQNFLLASISNNSDDIAKEDFSRISKYIEYYLKDLTTESLNFLTTLSSFKVDENLENLFIKLPIYMQTKLDDSKKIDVWKIKTNNLSDADNSKPGMQLEMSLFDTSNLPTKLTPSSSEEFELNFDFENIITQRDLSLISKITSTLMCCLHEYTNDFFIAFSGCFIQPSEFEIYYYVIYLYILSKVQNVAPNNRIVQSLLTKKVWTPGISIYNKSDTNFSIVTFLRQSVLQVISTNFPKLIKDLLISLKQNPFLFAETLGRIHAKLSRFDLLTLCDEMTLSCIIEVLSNLTKMLVDRKDIECTIHEARSTIIIFIFAMLDNQTIALHCFTSHVFLIGFLSRITEISIQASLVISLRQFLSNFADENISLLQPVSEFICGIIDKNRMLQTEDDRLTLDLLKSINESITHSKFITTVFRDIPQYALNYLITKPSVELLNVILSLYQLMLTNLNDFSFDLDTIHKLSDVIKKIGIKNDSQTMPLLQNMMAKSKSRNADVLFIIHEPSVILLIFSIISSKSELEKMLSFFLQLCKFCIYNCQMCHKGALDKLLLTYLKNLSKPFVFRGFTFEFDVSEETVKETIFPLINILFVTSSNVQIPSYAIDILVPDSQNKFCKYSQEVLSLLHSALSVISSEPKIDFMCGNPSQNVIYNDFKMMDIADGFTFKFKIRYDSPLSVISNSRPLIFSISDNEEINFQVFIRGDSLMCRTYLYKSKSSSIATLSSSLSHERWHKIACNVTFLEGNIVNLSIIIDNKKVKYYNINFPNYISNDLMLELGGFCDESFDQNEIENDFFCAISKLKIYGCIINLDQNFREYKDKIIFSKEKFDKCEVTLNGMSFPKTIYDSFLYCGNISLFIPLFKFINTMPIHFLEVLIEILTLLVCHSVENEKSFMKYIPLIANYLYESDLSYTIFYKLTLFFSSLNYPEMIEKFLEEIIFNFEIWSKIDAQSLQKIVSYWSSLVDYQKIINISNLIPKMRIYFYYEPIESELIFKQRDPNLDVEFCRMKLNSLILNLNFTEKDYLLIISHCTVCKDKTQVLDLLKLLLNLTRKNQIQIPNDFCHFLFLVLKPNNDKRFLLIVKLMCEIGGEKTMEYLRFITMNVTFEGFANKTVFSKLLKKLTRYPSLIVLLSWMSSYLGEEEMSEFANTLISIDQVNFTDKFWFLPLLLVYFTTNDTTTRGSIYVYLTLQFKKEDEDSEGFLTLLYTILLICYIGNYNIDLYLKQFLVDVNDIDDKLACVFLFVILYHPNINCFTNYMQLIFDFSSFNTEKRETKTEEFGKPNFTDFISMKEFLNEPIKSPQFMLRLTRELNFLNKDLVLKIIEKQTDNKLMDLWLDFLTKLLNKEEDQKMNLKILETGDDFLQSLKNTALDNMVFVKNSLLDYLDLNYDIDPTLISVQSTNISRINHNKQQVKCCGQKIERNLIKKFQNGFSIWNNFCHNKIVQKRSNTMSKFLTFPYFTKTLSFENKLENEFSEEKVPLYKADCKQIKISGVKPAKLLIYKDSVQIVKMTSVKTIKMSKIIFVLPRKRFLQPNSIEIFTKNQSYLLDFSPQTNENVLKELKGKNKGEIKKYTKQWISNNLSTYEYLIYINLFAGRSFNDFQIYPIFPWFFHKDQKRDFSNESLTDFIASDRAVLPPFCVKKLLTKNLTKSDINDVILFPDSISELIPEYFLCPDVIPDFEGKIDYVLKNISSLEDEEKIVNWIDNVFGCEMSKKYGILFQEQVFSKLDNLEMINDGLRQGGQMPIQLFKEKHPLRDVKTVKVKNLEVYNFGTSFDSIFLEKMDENKISFVCVKNTEMSKATVNVSNSNVSFEKYQFAELINLTKNDRIYQIDDGISIFRNQQQSLYILDSTGNREWKYIFNPSFVENEIICSNNGLLYIKGRFTVCFADELQAFCYSKIHKLLIVGTLDNFIICYKQNGTVLFSLKIDDFVATKIAISDIFGFVFCSNSEEIVFISPSGNLIHRMKINIQIQELACVSTKGRDFVVSIDNKGFLRKINYSDNLIEICQTSFNFRGPIKSCLARKDFLIALTDSSAVFIPAEFFM
ncbi:hypothetical protein TVAG_095190 [Trichomonas vaginalis G3]|uniref:BEACH-type PH domain-containing protein n=1 Tax=Trichomonas vaginalis (strain ATCC PRA-98 / G3) TaxID=412133 RepID=A2G1J6_TRIV3|nr:aggrephagy protein [Trichomonas vaginalis G3]EAX88971.1 hypothetical protein TVAG_095190 [Trichomonas vaginalis G3]KAI5533048.1 aggrephagy protein [Trichomonas vaginalis G3]|eukprot:XP_001301901.1 hypothetical protein [Trichomonas vaginalis G3]